MKKLLLPLFLLLVLVLAACQAKHGDPVSVYLNPDYLPSTFELDGDIILDGVKITVTYEDGSTKEIDCERSMIENFSTSTTGQKAMHAVYEGIVGNQISYYVYNPEGVSRTVETTTRIKTTKTYSDGKKVFTFSLRNVDIDIRALSFTITGTQELSDDSLSELHGVCEGAVESFYWKKTGPSALNVVLYAPPESKIVSNFFTLEWICAEDLSITVSDVTASDGRRDYYLPKA